MPADPAGTPVNTRQSRFQMLVQKDSPLIPSYFPDLMGLEPAIRTRLLSKLDHRRVLGGRSLGTWPPTDAVQLGAAIATDHQDCVHHPDDKSLLAGLYFVEEGEVLAARGSTFVAVPSLVAMGGGAVLGEECLRPLLRKHGLVTAPSILVNASDRQRARTRKGLADVVSINHRSGRTTLATTVDSIIAFLSCRAIADVIAELENDPPRQAHLLHWLYRIHEVNRNSQAAVQALQQSPLFSSLSESQLHALLEGADHHIVEAGAYVPSDDTDMWADTCSSLNPMPPGTGDCYVVLRGELEVHAFNETFPSRTINPRGTPFFNGLEVGSTVALRARMRSQVIRIRKYRVKRLLERNLSFCRRLVTSTLPDTPLGTIARATYAQGAELVGVCRTPNLEFPLTNRQTLLMLAAEVKAQFGEEATVVVVDPKIAAGAAKSEETEGIEVLHIPMPQLDDGNEEHAITWCHGPDALLDAMGAEFRTARASNHYIFMDLDHCADAWQLQFLVHSWVLLTDSNHRRPSPDANPDASQLHCLRIDRMLPTQWDSNCNHAVTVPLRSARLDLSDVEAAHAAGLPIARQALPPTGPTRRTLSRLARAVTDRTVGVALGGGGALGFSHIALLEGLVEAGVPIDVVSGTSFGALVGAFYSAREGEGLRMLRRDLPSLQLATMGAMVWGGVLRDWVDARLVDPAGRPLALESTPVQFIPVATNALNLGAITPVQSSLGMGVWASGAVPPLYTAPGGPDVRFLDGIYVANVPSDILASAGASYIIASNPISPPTVSPPRGKRFKSLVRMWLAPGLNADARAAACVAITQGQHLRPYEVERGPSEGPLEHLRGALRSAALSGRVAVVGGTSRAAESHLPLAQTAMRGARYLINRTLDSARGGQTLIATLSQDSGARADVVFAPELYLLTMVKYLRGRDIIDISREDLDASDVVAQARAAWERLCQPVLLG
jgi:predicted acylesterase/phospholipase RssA